MTAKILHTEVDIGPLVDRIGKRSGSMILSVEWKDAEVGYPPFRKKTRRLLPSIWVWLRENDAAKILGPSWATSKLSVRYLGSSWRRKLTLTKKKRRKMSQRSSSTSLR